MFGVRILLFIVAYVVVIAEIIVGAKAPDKIIWIIPGGLVIALLLSVSMFILSAQQDGSPQNKGGVFEWIALLLAGMVIAAASFYFQGVIFPFLMENT